MTRFDELLRQLAQHRVDFLVVGGVAAAAHGSARSTQDLDVLYSRNTDNLQRLADALKEHSPYLRGAPPGLPFRFDVETLKAGHNFTLTTELGWIDLFASIPGGGTFEELQSEAAAIDMFGVSCRVIDLDALIRTKRAAGRPKDFEVLAELELLRERRGRR